MLHFPSTSTSPILVISPLPMVVVAAMAPTVLLPRLRSLRLRQQVVSMFVVDLLCLQLLTLLWALLLRRPVRAALAILGGLLDAGLGAADAVDVMLSTEY